MILRSAFFERLFLLKDRVGWSRAREEAWKYQAELAASYWQRQQVEKGRGRGCGGGVVSNGRGLGEFPRWTLNLAGLPEVSD